MRMKALLLAVLCGVSLFSLCACESAETKAAGEKAAETKAADTEVLFKNEVSEDAYSSQEGASDGAESEEGQENADSDASKSGLSAEEIWAAMDISEDYRSSFVHGEKPAAYQKYIVLHDTEGEGSASSVVDWWDGNGQGVAAHFVVNKDGSIVQCVPLDKIAHHAGFGDTGHNELYGVEDESRDDKVGTTPIGSWAADYGMNSYSVGIEMVHVGGSGGYPQAQLQALDALISYIDAYYGFESQIIDHKAWRSGNSDTSPEFAGYFESYKAKRMHE